MAESVDIVKKSLVRRSMSDVNVLDYGKLPPQCKELEEAVLGAIMIESKAMDEVAVFLHPEMFYVDAHQRICRAIVMLHIQGDPIDLLTVTEQLKKNGELDAAGGPFYVAQLTNKVGSAANIEYHGRVVFEKWVQRNLISLSTEVIKDAYEDTTDVFALFDKAEKFLREMKQKFTVGSVSTTAAALEKADNQQNSGFVRSKHNFINKAFNGGWQKGTLNIVAARPGMGKSAWHVSELVHTAMNNSLVASFNLEMMERQLMARMICNLSKIPNTRYFAKRYFAGDEEKIAQAREWIIERDRNMTLDFTAGITVYNLISKMEKIKADKGLDVAFIDHLQFITLPPADTKGKTKDQQIGDITRALKTYAKDNDVALVVLCHLSRATESTTTKRPGLAHLRESGNIENDADTVSFLFRPEYYFKKDENGVIQYEGDEQEQYRGICQWLNDKNRDGHLFESSMKCNLGISDFNDNTDSKEEPNVQKSYPTSSEEVRENSGNPDDEDTPF